ncbi:MAG: hypothetical protein LIP02_05125, partial [Bacteroidales bacterium]|nr:hypothetical protein [Bacteroidales bacterium]
MMMIFTWKYWYSRIATKLRFFLNTPMPGKQLLLESTVGHREIREIREMERSRLGVWRFFGTPTNPCVLRYAYKRSYP